MEPSSNVTPLRGDGPDDTGSGGGALGYREPPHNLELEAALIGAILRNNRAFEDTSDIVQEQHFHAPEHRRIFRAIRAVIERGQIANPVTLKHFFDSDEGLKAAGGPEYLFDLAANVVPVVNTRHYAEELRDLYIKRELIGLGESLVNRAYTPDLEDRAPALIESAEQGLYNLAVSGELDRGVKSLADAAALALSAAEEAFQRDSHVVGVTSGFTDLDNMLGGLHRSDLVILAGRPSMGKTALATNISFNAASRYREILDETTGHTVIEGGKVLFFSLEMSAEQLAARILAERSEVSSDKTRRGEISGEEFNRLALATQELQSTPLMIDDTPALTISGLRQRARRVQRKHGLHLIVVDYLQLLQGSGENGRAENRVQEISEITRGLKSLAKDLNVPVIALSQLSRQVEQREDKRPQLSDLRESGSIEQDADVVMFVFREEYYLQRGQPTQRDNEDQQKYMERAERHNTRLKEVQSVAEIIIAKQRHGPVGTVELHFHGDFTRFSDLTRRYDDDGL